MSAQIIQFPTNPTDELPPLKERLEARRAYRLICRNIATAAVSKAFTDTLKSSGSLPVYVDDAASIFVAAMRRELRTTGLF
jgi:hypothetical protein